MTTNYLVAVLPDRIQAEEAYMFLEREGLSKEQIAILGRGFKSADEYGLADPVQESEPQIRNLALWVLPFGFGAGFIFNWLTGIYLVPAAGDFINHVIGGGLGALAGLMGSFFTGGWAGFSQAGDALTYRNRLEAGKYLVIVRGTAALTDWAREVLRPFNPEKLQGYIEPGTSTLDGASQERSRP
ncbi:hypothetical protein [Candidatus Cyanaurora vandensis]|uniref:hypothetical protein n=1 Tax=Candidatus Cyanaurora vandensis TaxID=2714958 RepID=UPI00257BC338|nr:hypothetical protein [Candidatus Cyanaurora vandensis]